MISRVREKLIPDGATTVFNTAGTYAPNTVYVFWNGQLMPSGFVTELGGTAFQLADVVAADESLQVDYQPVV